MYAFGRDTNIEWKHGIVALTPENMQSQGRISIIAWGCVDQDKAGSRVAAKGDANSVPPSSIEKRRKN